LGEQFECVWKYQTSQSEFYAEQVSHHPPVSAFYYRNKNKNLLAYGNLEPQASLHPFGNYAATSIVGKFIFRICNYEEDYEWIYPSIYTRGVFYGTLNMENAGESEVSCSKTGFSCKFDWKDSRTVVGKVYKKDQHLYTITGDYTDQIQIKHLGKKVSQLFFFQLLFF
jgi:oxysterol-binding protein-related protein 8